jgi:tetratricopeptide (TPR) repeat protein
MRNSHIKLLFSVASILALSASCKKGWLDLKPNSQNIVLNTYANSISDYQTLLQHGFNMIALGEVGADNYYKTNSTLQTIGVNLPFYLWAPNGYESEVEGDWDDAYSYIYTCNVAIEGMDKITKNQGNAASWNNAYGMALFWRGYNYFQLSQVFTKWYDSTTAGSDPGVPLRLTANVTQGIGRGTVQQLYHAILSDLLQAKGLLPDEQQYATEPTRAGCFAVLAELYLSMRDYADALANADSALQIKSTLMDYNDQTLVHPNAVPAFPVFSENPEVYFYAYFASSVIFFNMANIDSLLYQSYDPNDLRETCFYFPFRGYPTFGREGYDGTSRFRMFGAPAVDEMYLTRAECYARAGDASDALSDLNTLLQKRWITNTYTPYSGLSADSALSVILVERRKELVMRGSRWSDLRRLNLDPRFSKSIVRIYNNQTYILSPGSNLYVWPIPQDEILYSGIQQNPR